jgi:hypothetical protein
MSNVTFAEFTPTGQQKEEPALSEPVIVSDIFVSGLHVTRGEGWMRFVGWTSTGGAEGEFPERRIVVRFAMPEMAVRKLRHDLNGSFQMPTEH